MRKKKKIYFFDSGLLGKIDMKYIIIKSINYKLGEDQYFKLM